MRKRTLLISVAMIAVAVVAAAWTQLPELAAGGLLHPARTTTTRPPPDRCVESTSQGDGVALAGWRCSTPLRRRGTIVYLHGVADNRGSSSGVIGRFIARGFDAVAYDSRAHGASAGEAFVRAERDGHFRVDEVSPAVAAARIGVPVLLLHGALDRETSPAHSERVYAALRAPKQLILVPGAHHNQSLAAEVWPDIERWIDRALVEDGRREF